MRQLRQKTNVPKGHKTRGALIPRKTKSFWTKDQKRGVDIGNLEALKVSKEP